MYRNHGFDLFFIDQNQAIVAKRKDQDLTWLWQLVNEGIKEKYLSQLNTQMIKDTEQEIRNQSLSVPEAASRILKLI